MGDVMPAPASNQQRPVLVIPPSPSMKVRRAPPNYKGPHLFTLFVLLLALLALARFLFVLIAPSALTSSTPDTPIDCNALLRAFDYTKIVDLQPGGIGTGDAFGRARDAGRLSLRMLNA